MGSVGLQINSKPTVSIPLSNPLFQNHHHLWKTSLRVKSDTHAFFSILSKKSLQSSPYLGCLKAEYNRIFASM